MRKQLHTNSAQKSTITSFTGKKRVNQLAGKNLGTYSLFASQGDALSPPYLSFFEAPVARTMKGLSGLGCSPCGSFAQGHQLLLCLGLLMLLPDQAWAHTGDLFTSEIGKVEKLITGGYMRLGLLGVCGATAVTGAIQQNAWMFITGILAGVFAYFMKDWILSTFSMVI